MSQWKDNFESHPVHKVIDETLDRIDLVKSSNPEDEIAIPILIRLSKVLNMAKKRYKSYDPYFTPLGPLTNVQNIVNRILKEVNNYESNKNSAHLTNTNNPVDEIIIVLNTNSPDSNSICNEDIVTFMDDYHNEFESFSKSAKGHLDSISAENSILEEQTQTAIQELTAQRSRIDDAINSFQERFTNSEEIRDKDIHDTINEYTSELHEIKKERVSVYKEFEDSEKSSMESLRSELRKEAETSIEMLETHLEEAQKLIHVITNTGMVGGYQSEANSSRTLSSIWKAFTLLSMFGLIWFSIYSVTLVGGNQEFDYGLFAGRLFVAATFGILAAFCSRQSDRYDDREKKSRKTELELASISPYLVGLPEDKQIEIKTKLAEHFFGRKEVIENNTDSKTTGTSIDSSELIKILLEALKN